LTAPWRGARTLDDIPFDALLARLDRGALVRSRWGYPAADDPDGLADLDLAVASLRAAGGVAARARFGLFDAAKPTPDIVEVADPVYGRHATFEFPRERNGKRRSVADYIEPGQPAAFFCATLGRTASVYLRTVLDSGDSAAYALAHGLLAGLAEAAAAMVHERVLAELLPGVVPRGKRYSFGFPGCPGVEANGPLVDLLGGQAIGLGVTAGSELDPEFSVTALVVTTASAEYFSA